METDDIPGWKALQSGTSETSELHGARALLMKGMRERSWDSHTTTDTVMEGRSWDSHTAMDTAMRERSWDSHTAMEITMEEMWSPAWEDPQSVHLFLSEELAYLPLRQYT